MKSIWSIFFFYCINVVHYTDDFQMLTNIFSCINRSWPWNTLFTNCWIFLLTNSKLSVNERNCSVFYFIYLCFITSNTFSNGIIYLFIWWKDYLFLNYYFLWLCSIRSVLCCPPKIIWEAFLSPESLCKTGIFFFLKCLIIVNSKATLLWCSWK